MPDLPPVVIRRLRGEDWEAFRQIRLRALAEAPGAFSSTLAEAVELAEQDWRDRLSSRAQFIAAGGGEPLGTAGGIVEHSRAELISMWVDPRSRGAGVGDRLVGAVVDWARGEGHQSIRLWVAEGNHAAEHLYARHGFSRTGVSQPLNLEQPERREFEMILPL